MLEGVVLGAKLGITLGIELGVEDGDIVGLMDMPNVFIFDIFAVVVNPCPSKTSSIFFFKVDSRVALATFSVSMEGSINSTVKSIDTYVDLSTFVLFCVLAVTLTSGTSSSSRRRGLS